MEYLNEDLDRYYETIDEVNECQTCGDAVSPDKDFCSEKCWQDDNNS